MTITVTTESLRQACSQLLDHLEQVAGDEVSIDGDYFWSIDRRELYDPATLRRI